jgi:SOS-response transcriptional repressor LexA
VRILGVDLHPDAVSVPLFSDLPDGRGTRPEGDLTLDRRLAGAKGGFLVRARGDELRLLGIDDGDLLLVEPAAFDEVPHGSLVALRRATGRAAFQRFARNGRGVYLQALTPDAEPELVDEPGRVQLLGRVAGLFRRFGGSGASVSLTAH